MCARADGTEGVLERRKVGLEDKKFNRDEGYMIETTLKVKLLATAPLSCIHLL